MTLAGNDSDYEVKAGHRSGIVAVVGRPNVGKSTLINALMGQKIAIVTPRPQTTRQRQLAIITTDDYQVIFADTPGVMDSPRHKLDEYMLAAALETLQDADVVLWLVDGSAPPEPADLEVAARLAAPPGENNTILVLNKGDLISPEEVVERTGTFGGLLPGAPVAFVSALRGHGVTELLGLLVESLPEGPRYYPADQTTDAYIRDIAGELIREQLLLRLREELPYGVAVKVEEYKERPNGTTYINAVVYVERESHKGIVIGAGGRQLREIGTAARKEIERLVEGKVYLELRVKVAPRWRQDEGALRRFGYSN